MWKILGLLITINLAFGLDFSCRDQNNRPVDWFIFYKLGRFKNLDNQNAHLLNGTAFLYMDANNKHWTFSRTGMESNLQAIGYTLQQYYDNQNDPNVTSIFWNDQLPYPQETVWSDHHGHSKGFFAFDTTKGFWMTHSIPRFPRNDTYEYPSNAHAYGQMGICVSLGFEALADLALQLYFIKPFIYSSTLPTSVAIAVPLLANVIAGEYRKTAPFYSLKTHRSNGGQSFYHFAKAGGFGEDLYYDLVAPSLQVSLLTESWQHGSTTNPNLRSSCHPPNKYQVFNVKYISLLFDIEFKNYYDHSKYAVSTNPDGDENGIWVCVGDVNRQTDQLARGGGTVCFQDKIAHTVFFESIEEYEECEEP